MTIFLVRHGETRLSGTFCGSSNPQLSSLGKNQAAEAAKHLSSFSINSCYSSPLLRAEQTADLIWKKRASPIEKHSALRELHFGAWEGLRFEDIQKKWPTLAAQWIKDPMNVHIPRAESFASLRKRIRGFINSISDKLLKQNVMFVAHGGSLAAIVLEMLGLPDHHFPKLIAPTGSVRMIQEKQIKTLC